jgi:hypothetical protein
MSRRYDPSVKGIRLIDLSGAVVCEHTGLNWQQEFEAAFIKCFPQIKRGEYTIQTYQISKTIYISGTQAELVWLPPFQSPT